MGPVDLFSLEIDGVAKTISLFFWIPIEAVARVCKYLSFERRRTLMKAFIESQFAYCPLIWMFCQRSSNTRINHLHERALRIFYNDNESTFEDLTIKIFDC